MCLLHMVLYAVMSKNGQAVQDAPPQPAAPATHAPKDAAAAGGKPAEATSAPAAQKADRGKAKPVRFDVMEVVNPATRLPMRYVRCGKACWSGEERDERILQLCFDIAISLIIVGGIFLGLSLAGEFPAAVWKQKYVGTYNTNVAKYSMYIFTGLLGAMAPILGAVALHRRASLKPCFWTFQLSLLSIVATLGLSIYMLEKSSELGMVWWQYLISALMIVQRLLFFVCAVLASISVWKAMHDDGVRARMEGATSWREHPVPSESDVEKGAAV